jgi:hypothetical protein
LGFDIECLGYYNIDPSLKHAYFTQMPPFDHEWCLAAPLYQQVFRWFREKYGYMGKVDAFFYPIGYTFRIDNLKDEVIVSWGEPENDFETYEEAELACLNKLIELVKNI